MKAATEKAFETYIQNTMANNGWTTGTNKEWDKQNALFPQYTLAFIKNTQPALWTQMEKLHGTALPTKLIETLIKERRTKGTLHIARHGFKFYGKTFKTAFFKPAHGLVQETLHLYRQNTLHVTRQVACHPSGNQTVDIVLSLNGIPIATMELKNPVTGQTWKDAVEQYKSHRDPRAPLFQFKKGAVVHFAVDPNEIHMATRLNRAQTTFLPFNRGSHPGEIDCGKGNPQHPSGHRTGYFWEDILQRDSFLDIIAGFIFIETDETTIEDTDGKRKKMTTETMIFPRFHQLDAVRKLIDAAKEEKTGRDYLIQHSAGSGKTKTIAWLSHHLSNLHTSLDQKIFDCVIVITDRRVLDKQLQDAVYQIEHAQGVVKPIRDNSRQLAEALVDGTKIVITTLQKFPFILRGLLQIAGAPNADQPDPAHLEYLKHELDSFQVYHRSEVEAFSRIFYIPRGKENPSDHARMEKHIQPAVDRFAALDDQTKRDFYDKLTAYVRFYSFISQIIPYSDFDHEMLYGFGRYLVPYLAPDEEGLTPHPEKDVELQYYRIEPKTSGFIVMDGGVPYGVKSPTAVGTGKAKDEEKPLSEIIHILNERFGTDFTEEDRLFFEQIKEKACSDDRVIRTAMANPLDKFELGILKIVESLMLRRMSENDDIVTRYMDDMDFQKTVFPILAREIYEGVLAKSRDTAR